MLQLNKSLY